MVAATLSQSDDDASGNINRGGLRHASIAQIDTARIINADSEPGNWLAYGRDYGEQRHFLTQVNKKTIEDLNWLSPSICTQRAAGSLADCRRWHFIYDRFGERGLCSRCQTGEEVWSYDPEVPGDWARKACCDVVNRGVAVYDGAVYVASLDGYLISSMPKPAKKFGASHDY